MKNILYYFIFAIGIFFLNSCVKAETTSCHLDGGRCTGSAYCSACSNCSRCGHCSAGGTCGVCAGNSKGRSFSSTPKKSKKTVPQTTANSDRKYNSTTNTKSTKSPSINNFYFAANGNKVALLISITPITNIRNSPSLEGKVLEQIKKNSQLIFLQNYEEWIKVKVKKSGTVCFVFRKNVK